jgi:hypothetical protein
LQGVRETERERVHVHAPLLAGYSLWVQWFVHVIFER